MKFAEFLNETLYSGSYYTRFSKKIEWKNLAYGEYFTERSTGNDVKWTPLEFSSDLLKTYKTNLSSATASDPRYNYIYEIKNARILDATNIKELEKALSKGMLDPYFEEMKNSWDPRKFRELLIFDKFFAEYDGWIEFKGRLIIPAFKDRMNPVLKNMKLVDGNAVRFNTGSESSNIEFPDDVWKDILRYTDEGKRKLSNSTKEWLKENFKKPYSSIKLYRAVGHQFDDYGDFSKTTLKDLEKTIFKYFNVRHLEELKRNATILLKRGKESSWSSKPIIAQNFARGTASKNINILVESDVTADMVLLDFNLLPKELLSKLPFWTQNEVIVDKGKIESKIKNIWTNENEFKDGALTKWLDSNGYFFKANSGFIKK